MRIYFEDYFTQRILNLGIQYYLQGNVVELKKIGSDVYDAVVEDSKLNYNVEIKKTGNGRLIMTCGCPYADNNNCKHMAAALLKIEAQDLDFFIVEANNVGKVKPGKAKIESVMESGFDFKPFPKNSFFTLDPVFAEFSYNIKDLAKAKSIVDAGLVKLAHANLIYDPESETKLNIKVNCEFDEIKSASMLLGRKKIHKLLCDGCVSYSSDCFNTDYYYDGQSRLYPDSNLCVHKLALLIVADEYIRSKNPGDYTDSNGIMLAKALKNSSVKEIIKIGFENDVDDSSESETIDMIPYLESDMSAGIGVSFSIIKESGKKSYVVKNCKDLVYSYESKTNIKYGKELSIDFSKDSFTDRAMACIRFIKYCQTTFFYNIARDIPIVEENSDEFFDTFSNLGICHNGRPVEFTKEKIKFNSVVSSYYVDGEFQGLQISFNPPCVYNCKKGKLSFNEVNNKVILTPNSEVGPLSGLFSDARDNFSAVLGKDKLSTFTSSVLPALKFYGNVDLTGCPEVENLKSAEPVFTFNIDYSKQTVLCYVSVSYGDETYKVSDSFADDKNRDTIAEEHVRLQLDEIFSQNDGNCWSESDYDGIYLILSQGLSVLMNLGIVNATDSFNALKFRRSTKTTASISITSNLLELEIKTDDISLEELLEIAESFKKHKVYHRLRDGSFVDLNTLEVKEISDFLSAVATNKKSIVKGKIKIPAYRALYIGELIKNRQFLNIDRKAPFKRMLRAFESFQDSEAEVPKSLEKVLRPYQADGFRWFETLGNYNFGGILADEMGLGKTVQILSYILYRKESGVKKPSMIICPASIVYNWASETKKFTPNLKCLVIAGKQSERENLIQKCCSYDLIVTSYDLLKRDIVDYEEISFDCLIIDEAQFIKNSNTEVSKSVKILSSDLRFALTGTPIENRLSELWSVFDFLMPDFLYNKESFRREFEIPIVKEQSVEMTDRLKKLVAPFILRRLKSDVLKDLPEKLEENRYVQMSDKQSKLYDAQVAKIKVGLKHTKDADFNKSKIEILSEITKLRQICCDPSLALDCCEERSTKRDLCIDLITDAVDSGHKILVFSQFTSMLDLLGKDIENAGFEFYRIDGSTDKLKRMELVDSFNSNSVPVFLISLKAGGTGLNLTGADIVIHYDPWWNVAVQNQATDRAHRIGQKNVVTVYKLIAKDTIEDKIVELQEKKKNLADEILSCENISLGSLSKEDILEIIG